MEVGKQTEKDCFLGLRLFPPPLFVSAIFSSPHDLSVATTVH